MPVGLGVWVGDVDILVMLDAQWCCAEVVGLLEGCWDEANHCPTAECLVFGLGADYEGRQLRLLEGYQRKI
jgi:hypothetical protein